MGGGWVRLPLLSKNTINMKTISTDKILQAYNLLNAAKYNKLSDADKIAILKITCTIKPIAVEYQDACKDAVEKLKFEGFDEQLAKARNYEKSKNAGDDNLPMSDEEYSEFIKKLVEYDKIVKDAIKQLGDKEVEIDVDTMTEDSFGKLMASNDWTMEQAMIASDIVC